VSARFSSPISSSVPGKLLSGIALNHIVQSVAGSIGPTPSASWSDADIAFMAQARAMARLGAGRTWTNPMVGAVVVHDANVLASAYHHRPGESHAECLAFAAAGESARGATLYVSLEPCAHHGRTPPCVEGILKAGIARVVIPAPDPDARVSGRGIESLRAGGVRVDVGCDAAAAILDNHGYYHDRLGVGRTVTLKLATSQDGRVARAHGRRDRVTGDEAQRDAHRLRAVHDAVAIGVETARIDRPRLDCRLLEAGVDREPTVVVFDSSLALANDADWPACDRDFIVMCGAGADARREHAIRTRGGRVVRCAAPDGRVDLREALGRLNELGMVRLLVEGGPRLLQSFIDAGAWDAFWHYRSNQVFGDDGVSGVDVHGVVADEMRFGDDVRRRFVNAASWETLTRTLDARVCSTAGRTDDVHGHR